VDDWWDVGEEDAEEVIRNRTDELLMTSGALWIGLGIDLAGAMIYEQYLGQICLLERAYASHDGRSGNVCIACIAWILLMSYEL
jgi:hypothetical protein